MRLAAVRIGDRYLTPLRIGMVVVFRHRIVQQCGKRLADRVDAIRPEQVLGRGVDLDDPTGVIVHDHRIG